MDHILTRQVYGIGITQLTALLARRSLYCSKYANGPHSIAKSFTNPDGNVWFERTEHTWTGGSRQFRIDPNTGEEIAVYTRRKCCYCGASENDYGRGDELETHAYAFIHTDNIKARLAELFGETMQFDVIIGNPPYQLSDSGYGSSAAPIYHRFVQQAKALEPKMLVLIIPARWYAGGKGLNDFRREMLHEGHIRELHDFPDTSDVFPGVNNRGGICYFLWDSTYAGPATIYTHEAGQITSSATRPMLEPGLDVFLRYNEGVEILKKVVAVERGDSTASDLSLPESLRFSKVVSSRKPFGLDTTFSGRKTRRDGDLTVYRNGGVCFARPEDVKAGHGLIGATKLLVPYSSPGSDEYPHLVLSKPIVAGPGEISTETYLVIGLFSGQDEAKNVATYMGTKFFRFMLTLLRVSQHVTRGVYDLAPMQDFSRCWTDEELIAKYSLTDEEVQFMDRFVKPVAWAEDYQ